MSPLLSPWLLVTVSIVLGGIWLAARTWAHGRPDRPPRHHDVLALAAVGGLVIAFFWRALLTADVYMPIGGGDLASFFYPLYTFIHRHVQETGQLPLWNPYAFSGAPLAADVQSGLWYPPNWVIWYLLPAPTFDANFVGGLHSAYALLEWPVILHYAWAALGMYLWLRDLRLARVAAVAGTAAFAFCGFMAAHFGHMPMIFAAAWLPWHLLITRRLVVQQSWGYSLLLGVTLGLTFLAGHPQTFLYELLVVALYWGWLEATRPAIRVPATRDPRALIRDPALLRLARPLLAAAIAAGLGMVQYLPSAELAEQSVRAAISWEEAGEHALQPVGLLNLVLPRVFGSNPTNYWVSWQSTENWGYLGVVALLLAGLALALRRDRITGFALTLGGLALLLSLGPFTQLFAWLHGLVPGFDRFRGAGRFLLEMGLATGLLAGLGLDGVLRVLAPGVSRAGAPAQDADLAALRATAGPLPTDAGRSWRVVRWALAGLCVALVLIVAPLFDALFLSTPSMERTAMVLNDLHIGIIWVLAVTGLLWLGARRRLAAGTLGVALTVLLVADLFAPNAAFNPTTTDLTLGYQNPDQIGLLYNKTDGRYRIDSDTGDIIGLWQPDTGVLMQIPDAGGLYNPLALDRYARVWGRIKAPLPDAPATVKDNRNSAWYDLLNIRYTIATYADRPRGDKFKEADSNARGVHVYENANAMPRAFVVHDAQVIPDPEQQFSQIDSLAVDPRHTVLLPDGAAVASATRGSAEGNADDKVQVTSYSPNRIEVSVQNTEPGWLVLSEVWYPGWTATLDGQRTTISQADYLLRAVQIGPGAHTLVLEFRSRLLLIGQIISVVTALVVLLAGLALGIRHFRRRRAAVPHSPQPLSPER
jgi:hypothetical protein